MPIEYKKTKATFVELVGIDETEGLLAWATASTQGRVDLAACSHVHPAVLQVILTTGLRVSAWPRETDLKQWLEPLLPAHRQGGDHG